MPKHFVNVSKAKIMDRSSSSHWAQNDDIFIPPHSQPIHTFWYTKTYCSLTENIFAYLSTTQFPSQICTYIISSLLNFFHRHPKFNMSKIQFLVFPLNCFSSAFPISLNGDSILPAASLKTLESYLTTPFLQYLHPTHPEILLLLLTKYMRIWLLFTTTTPDLATNFHLDFATTSKWSSCFCLCPTVMSS